MPNKALRFAYSLFMIGIGASLPVFAQAPTTGPTEYAIFDFPHDGSGGYAPLGALIQDKSGNLYGTASSGGANSFGAVFELVKPVAPATKWTEVVLYSFAGGTADGSLPVSELTFDSAGNLYGTTEKGGSSNEGTVFELSPPSTSGGAWSEVVIHEFTGLSTGDGSLPTAGVVFDKSGNLYGSTLQGGLKTGSSPNGDGIIFQLVPSDGTWTENIIYTFKSGLGAGPSVTPIFDNAGNLYGAGNGGKYGSGVVFKLSPPTSGTTWSYKILHTFGQAESGDASNPLGLVLRNGNLYGVSGSGGTGQGGTVFELAHPPLGGTTWTASILYNFGSVTNDGAFPAGHVTFDHSGNIWGVTSNGGGNGTNGCTYGGCGTVYELVLGSSGWTETIVHAFPASSKDGVSPRGALLLGSNGVLFGTLPSYATETGGMAFGVRP